MLAGLSADYYVRLERGKDRHPSAQVLSSLARVLRLDVTEEQHLLSMIAPRPQTAKRRPRLVERVPDRLYRLISALPIPAFIEGRWSDVLGANSLATALSPRLIEGHNRLRSFFLDPAEQDFHHDWSGVAPDVVAGLRQSIGTETDHPRAVELVGELSLGSQEFRRLWARHDVKRLESSSALFDHPLVGELALDREKLTSPEGLILVLYHPTSSDSAERLQILASYATEPHVRAGAESAVETSD